MTTPLLVTADAGLLDDVRRLAAAAGVDLVCERQPGAALRRWASAPLVLVGGDVAGDLVALAPGRRPGVGLVTAGPATERLLRDALALGAEQVLSLPGATDAVVGLLADVGDGAVVAGSVIGVVAGSGGAGASTLACAIGQVAARERPAVVLDTDPLGPGLDRVLGLDGEPGVRWDDLAQSSGRLGARSLRDALPSRDGLAVLTWSAGSAERLSPAAARQCVDAARRGHRWVVVDLARGPDPVVDEVALRCDVLVVVARSTVASVAATARVADRLADHPARWLVVRGGNPRADQVGEATGLPVLAAMSDQRRLAESVDLGLGPAARRGPLVRAAARVLELTGAAT